MKITIEAGSFAELAAELNKLSITSTDKAATPQEQFDAELNKEKKTRKAKEATPESNTPAPDAARPAGMDNIGHMTDAGTPATSTETANPYEAVKKATMDVVKAKGKPVVAAILAKFNAKSAMDLKPEQYEEYTEELKKVA